MSAIQRVVTSGTFSLDGGTWDVDNNIWLVGDDTDVIVFDEALLAQPFVTHNQDLLAVLRTAGLVADADTHRPGRAESLQPPGPAEYPARGFGALRSVHSEVPPAHRGAQFFFGHKTLLSGIKFPSVSIVIPQTMAIFACVK